MGRDIFRYRSFFPSIVISDRWRPTGSSCCQVCKLVSSRSRTAAMIAVGPNRKPPSPIKYDGLTRTVLEKVFRPVYLGPTDENADRSYLSGNLARGNVVVSMTKLSFCYTQALPFPPPPVSCLKSVSQRDTAVSSQKQPKSVLDTDDPYHVACL